MYYQHYAPVTPAIALAAPVLWAFCQADSPRVPALRPGMTGTGHAVSVTASKSSFCK